MFQISASAAREEATAALKAAQAKYPDVLGGQQSQVREKKPADKTPLFTAQFGPFASRRRGCGTLSTPEIGRRQLLRALIR
jgi:hypothetical protein